MTMFQLLTKLKYMFHMEKEPLKESKEAKEDLTASHMIKFLITNKNLF